MGFDRDYQTEDGYNLLTMALDYTHVEIGELLFEAGVNFKLDNASLTPLEAAIEGGAHDLILKMLEGGVDVNPKGLEEEMYPIHRLAWMYLKPEFFKAFMDAGADVDLKNSEDETAIDIVKSNNEDNPDHVDAIQEIVNILESHNNTLLRKIFSFGQKQKAVKPKQFPKA